MCIPKLDAAQLPALDRRRQLVDDVAVGEPPDVDAVRGRLIRRRQAMMRSMVLPRYGRSVDLLFSFSRRKSYTLNPARAHGPALFFHIIQHTSYATAGDGAKRGDRLCGSVLCGSCGLGGPSGLICARGGYFPLPGQPGS